MHPERDLTVEHVVPGYGRLGRRADNDPSEMTTLCWGHHLGHGVTGQGGSIWALGHKDELREWLATLVSDGRPATSRSSTGTPKREIMALWRSGRAEAALALPRMRPGVLLRQPLEPHVRCR